MSLELRLDDSLRKNIRRITRKQLDHALESLGAKQNGSRDVAVHEARKSFKRVRAVLRLVRSEIGERRYRKENRCFRDAGRPLTEVRDAKVLVETVDKLAKHSNERLTGQTFGDVHNALQDNLQNIRKQLFDEQDPFAVVAAAIRRARKRCENWADVRNKWSAVNDGLKETYRRARNSYRDAAADHTVEKLHEWRKQIKYLRYQLEILRPIGPERMDELVQMAETMGELLGEDHDLAVLQETLSRDSERFGDEPDIEGVITLAQRRRSELQQQAMLLGERFFQDRPRRFARRLKEFWKAAKSRQSPNTVDAA